MKNLFAVVAGDAILYAAQHLVFQFAARRQLYPLLAGSAIGEAFKSGIGADLCRARRCRRYLEAQHVTTFAIVARVTWGHLRIMLELALCRNAFGKDDRLADERAFA